MKKDYVNGIALIALILAMLILAAGCASAPKDPKASTQAAPKSKVDSEKLISQFSNAKDEGAEAITSKERFEEFIRHLANFTIAWDDASAYMSQMDDGTAMQEVRFALRLNESKPAVLDLFSKDGWMWQSENMMGDKEPGAVNILVRRVLVSDGNPAVELILVARDRNKKVTCKGITRSRFYGNEGAPGVLPNTVSVNEAVTFIEGLLK